MHCFSGRRSVRMCVTSEHDACLSRHGAPNCNAAKRHHKTSRNLVPRILCRWMENAGPRLSSHMRDQERLTMEHLQALRPLQQTLLHEALASLQPQLVRLEPGSIFMDSPDASSL